MKKYALLYAILAVIVMAGFLLAIATQKIASQQEPDYVAINEIAKQAGQNWAAPEELSRFGSIYRYTIIDNNGIALYSSDDGLPGNIPAAIRRGFAIVDITAGSAVVGKALIEASPGIYASNAQNQQRLAAATLVAFGSIAALNLAFLFALHSALIKPFGRMQSFAHKISAGKLDEPLPMDKNNIFGLFTQSFDMMRESLLEARKNQLQAERAKKELIASLSHDVKTPVTSIRLICELLQARTADPATMEKLKTIEIKADQIDRLMNDMLHSALEELGELNVTVAGEQSVVLGHLFADADHLSRVRASEIPASLLEFDRMRMEQVIGNIVANSYKYAGTPIDVDFMFSGEFLQVDINDYGKGVDPEELELITTKFYRGENAKTSPKEGEGLGLYIAKLLMDKMGGGLEAFNRDDGFTVRLWIRLSR